MYFGRLSPVTGTTEPFSTRSTVSKRCRLRGGGEVDNDNDKDDGDEDDNNKDEDDDDDNDDNFADVANDRALTVQAELDDDALLSRLAASLVATPFFGDSVAVAATDVETAAGGEVGTSDSRLLQSLHHLALARFV